MEKNVERFDAPAQIHSHVVQLAKLMIEHKLVFGCVFGNAIGTGNFLIMSDELPYKAQKAMLEDLRSLATEMLNELQSQA